MASYKHKADAAAQAARAAAATADAAAPLLKESEHQVGGSRLPAASRAPGPPASVAPASVTLSSRQQKVDGSQSLSGSATDQSFDPDGSRSKAAQA